MSVKDMETVKIAFIKTNMFGQRAGDAMAPLVFAIIKALTPEDITISFYDENVEKIPQQIEAEVVALTTDTFNAKRAYQLAAAYRSQGLKVIMGGFHPTMLPDECLDYADAVVIGEAEDTWNKVLEDLQRNT
ncbi:MAG TPA: cobalamin-dependent protein, partial [Desulfitobacteriaceae bacterium]|nr:cobalamin-dependent protein [Desulfitobacteriaceae bacterium]